ncbi:membrane steroid-binding protein 2-like [Olea europaea var. sylvestris]|uniref:membrane steroid-binding protein 2-like n=1 Tax=Olea europaea var. sylvestris TaxID=158386 RepID=UPI000C1D4646|nr:membrane steroid-binding protein 2-like [Olea europaea var. sylvestris]
MALQLWEALKESITAYTGLSPSTFFSVLCLGLTLYYMVSNLFGSSDDGPGSYQERSKEPEEKVQPLPPPVQLGDIADEELKQYDGSDKSKPLLMAIKGQIYDVSQSRLFYGPGGPYALFAGKDASRALAKMSFEKNDLNGDLTGLGAFELEALQDWEYKFMSKYVKVGTVKSSIQVTDGPEIDSAKPTEDAQSVSSVPEIVEAVPNVDADKKE